MNILSYDTLAAVKRMKAQGIPPEYAEVFAEELRAAQPLDFGELVVKQDIANMATKQDFANMATKQDLAVLQAATKQDLSALELKMDAKIESAKADILKWMFGGFLAVIGLLVGVLLKVV